MKTFREYLESLNESTLTIYHGDNYGTTRLDPRLMNNGNNQEGVGIYFSTSLKSAQDYGSNVISAEVDKSKFIPSRDFVQKHLSKSNLIKLFKELHSSNEEEFFYFVSDYVEVSDIPDVNDQHIQEMTKYVQYEQIRNFQVDMANRFGAVNFVNAWNKIFKNIHGTYNANSKDEDWYCIINDKIRVNKVQ